MKSRAKPFSFRTREQSIERFKSEIFDLLVIGGGITGAAVARDAASRGLKVALVERRDFAFGTSSRSSKLIHGGLRYLENFEFGLVFEALAERALLLKTVPHMVRPLPFYLPVYKGDPHGRAILSLGLWLYDVLALFRTPGFHKRLSKREVISDIPFLQQDGLMGGFRYYDASMWDDVLAIETLRAAQETGAAVANYVEALKPIWVGDRITGFQVRDLENPKQPESFPLRAHRTVVCAGPWTDQIGAHLANGWRPWLNPSKGVHLIFDLKRIPIPGAMIMSHPEDGRIVFVIPRPEYGAGVVIVGTTDSPANKNPEEAQVTSADVNYLMNLLKKYFPQLNISNDDILSAYVGVRPLMGNAENKVHAEESARAENLSPSLEGSHILQKVSREHHIDRGPGGTVVVAGGKYTTHRKMAEEIVDYTLKIWKEDRRKKPELPFPEKLKRPQTKAPVNPDATPAAIQQCREVAAREGIQIPEELVSRYGAQSLDIWSGCTRSPTDPPGFPCLSAQLRHSIRTEMVLHLEDFYLRRVALYASRKDHGLPWAKELAQVWAEERGLDSTEIQPELERLQTELKKRSSWQQKLDDPC